MPKIGLIVQARMGSTRLPGKSLLPLAGEPLVYRILERLKRVNLIDELILAIPESDILLKNLGGKCGVSTFLGSEDDVLDRYYQAAKCYNLDIVLRVPADNVASEPSEVDKIITFYLENNFDFCSNLSQVLCNNYPDGIGAEVFSFSALQRAWENAILPEKREHVHLNFFNYTTQRAIEGSSIGTMNCPEAFARPDIVLDVNTQSQYEKMSNMYADLYPKNPLFSIMDIILWWDKYKEKEKFDLVAKECI